MVKKVFFFNVSPSDTDFLSSLTAPLAQSTFTVAINIRGDMEISK